VEVFFYERAVFCPAGAPQVSTALPTRPVLSIAAPSQNGGLWAFVVPKQIATHQGAPLVVAFGALAKSSVPHRGSPWAIVALSRPRQTGRHQKSRGDPERVVESGPQCSASVRRDSAACVAHSETPSHNHVRSRRPSTCRPMSRQYPRKGLYRSIEVGELPPMASRAPPCICILTASGPRSETSAMN